MTMHVSRASRQSYAAFLGYHLGKVLGYERLQDYSWDDVGQRTWIVMNSNGQSVD